MTAGPQGLFFGGGFAQLGKQVWPRSWSPSMRSWCRFALAKLIDRVIGFRVSGEDETAGVDFTQHAETAYAEGVQARLRPGDCHRSAASKTATTSSQASAGR